MMRGRLWGSDSKVIHTRWVITNKGDTQKPDIRARLVACELNTFKSDDLFSATPPLEAKRVLLSTWARERKRHGHHLKLHVLNVRKAYFNALPQRNIYIYIYKSGCLLFVCSD